MQDVILLWALMFGTALFSSSGAAELVVGFLFAAALVVMALRSLSSRHADNHGMHRHWPHIWPRR